jgi:predicted dienelactone hydrolase
MSLRFATRFAAVAFACFTATAGAAEWLQAPRDDGARTPLRVFVPDSGTTCAPLAVISPGAGGSENGLEYIADSLREGGFVAIVLGHVESGAAPLKEKMRKSGVRGGLLELTTDPAAYRDRLLDIGAALKWIGAPACRSTFSVLIGHSMGAATVMIEAGAQNQLGVKGSDRFDAYVAISPQGPGSIFPEHAWTKVHRPLLMLTGTRDNALEGDWRTRTKPFDDLPGGCKWIGVINGASHLNFAGIGSSAATQKLTLLSLNSFLDSVRNNCVTPPPTAKGIYFKWK